MPRTLSIQAPQLINMFSLCKVTSIIVFRMTQKWYTILLRQAEQKRQKTERKSGSTSCKVSNRMYWIQTTWNNKTSGLKNKTIKKHWKYIREYKDHKLSMIWSKGKLIWQCQRSFGGQGQQFLDERKMSCFWQIMSKNFMFKKPQVMLLLWIKKALSLKELKVLQNSSVLQ